MKGFYSKKAVLVTGAGGFIGSHLVEALAGGGARVRAFLRYNSRADPGALIHLPPALLAKVELIAGDLRDLPALIEAMHGVEVVFHLGALIAVPYSYQHPWEVAECNIMGTLNVLLAARETGASRLVHTSSSEVYGTAQRVPMDESHPLQGQSPYSASKIAADMLAESFYRSYDLPLVTLRPFNTYGPRQSARAIVPSIIVQALTRNMVKLGNLAVRRDLTYASDTVDGFLRAGAAPGVEGQTINLGSGNEVSIADLAREIITMVDRPLQVVREAARLRPEKSEVQRLLADNSCARERLGWRPKVTLRSGLWETIRWIADHMHLFHADQYQV